MFFKKDVDREQIEKYENDILKKITDSSMFVLLKNELIRKELIYQIEVQHSESNLKKYIRNWRSIFLINWAKMCLNMMNLIVV